MYGEIELLVKRASWTAISHLPLKFHHKLGRSQYGAGLLVIYGEVQEHIKISWNHRMI